MVRCHIADLGLLQKKLNWRCAALERTAGGTPGRLRSPGLLCASSRARGDASGAARPSSVPFFIACGAPHCLSYSSPGSHHDLAAGEGLPAGVVELLDFGALLEKQAKRRRLSAPKGWATQTSPKRADTDQDSVSPRPIRCREAKTLKSPRLIALSAFGCQFPTSDSPSWDHASTPS